MASKGAAAGQPQWQFAARSATHMLSLGRGQAAGYWAYCTNQAPEGNSRRFKKQCKAEAGAPPVVIPPILEIDHQRLISSKVASTCLSLPPSAHVVTSCSVLDPSVAGIIHPTPRRDAL